MNNKMIRVANSRLLKSVNNLNTDYDSDLIVGLGVKENGELYFQKESREEFRRRHGLSSGGFNDSVMNVINALRNHG
ncbi:hypothetical protein [Leptospira bandrabouensis]|uniref:hypothetical protein n=2 Tax=Leptospiraceae TaxID=170 RepID=UPI001EE92F2F|nr:hypothetical protein [Leptospira bandrabouensis]MCG6145301.1 hypothetical protein [Leptospira bandrabouensis]MCG6160925.1 hypothetical protein [Leptospira bandrabouensis]MCG6164951.1 hypothetical protein [Leptospira bandrabouensis]